MKTLTIKTLNVTLTANDEGMYDLNDLWRQAKLEEKKRPNRWVRSEQGQFFIRTPNLASATLTRATGQVKTYIASEQAVYAYAMYVSVEFYIKVVEAFTLMAQGKEAEAKKVVRSATEIVHEATLLNKPAWRIREFLADYDDISKGVVAWIKAMGYNSKADYSDRVRTLKSLSRVVEQSYDTTSPRDTYKHIQHEVALKEIYKEEKYQAKIHSALVQAWGNRKALA